MSAGHRVSHDPRSLSCLPLCLPPKTCQNPDLNDILGVRRTILSLSGAHRCHWRSAARAGLANDDTIVHKSSAVLSPY